MHCFLPNKGGMSFPKLTAALAQVELIFGLSTETTVASAFGVDTPKIVLFKQVCVYPTALGAS